MTRRTVVLGTAVALLAVCSVFACTGSDATSSVAPDAGATGTFDSGSAPDSSSSADAAKPKPDSGTQDSGADAGPPLPTALGARLVLWLAADRGFTADGVGPLVWKDQSGAGNDATQDTVAKQPARLDGSGGGVGGKPTLHFTGAEYLQIADRASLQWSASDFSVFCVERHTNPTTSYALLYAKWTDVPPFPGFFLWADYPTTTGFVTRLDENNAAFSTDAGYNDETLRVVGARKHGNDLQLFVGSTLAGENAATTVADPAGFDAVGLPVYLGGRPAGIQMLQGDISEVVAVKGTLTDAEMTNLQAYLKAKYSL